MRYLTNTTSDERNDMVNSGYMTKGTFSTLAQLLQVITAHEDDNKGEDPDGYWHP